MLTESQVLEGETSMGLEDRVEGSDQGEKSGEHAANGTAAKGSGQVRTRLIEGLCELADGDLARDNTHTRTYAVTVNEWRQRVRGDDDKQGALFSNLLENPHPRITGRRDQCTGRGQ